MSCRGSGAVEDRRRDSLEKGFQLSFALVLDTRYIPHDVTLNGVAILVIYDKCNLEGVYMRS